LRLLFDGESSYFAKYSFPEKSVDAKLPEVCQTSEVFGQNIYLEYYMWVWLHEHVCNMLRNVFSLNREKRYGRGCKLNTIKLSSFIP
jgi:hypothetical protein